MSNSQHLYCGLMVDCVPDLLAELTFARQSGFDFLVTPLAHPRYKRALYQIEAPPSSAKNSASPTVPPVVVPVRTDPFTRSDMILSSGDWSTIVGMVSNWIELDSPVPAIRRNSELVYKQEMSWASHLSLSAVLLPILRSYDCVNFSKCLNQTLSSGAHLHFWLPIPLTSSSTDDDEVTREDDPWEWWNRMRVLCDHNLNLSPVLELTENLPSHRRMLQWLGEPIKAIIIPAELFMTNKKGFPVLSTPHREFVQSFFKFNVEFVIRGGNSGQWENDGNSNNMSQYKDYIHWLQRRAPQPTEQESFEQPYLDYLQVPLQPLMDNLESQTYEVFERDPIKYKNYEEAVYLALMDRKKDVSSLVVMVLGAGRGPLVRASLQAAKRAEFPIKLYAVEKNPNAVVTLKNMHHDLKWGEDVVIVDSDMRVLGCARESRYCCL